MVLMRLMWEMKVVLLRILKVLNEVREKDFNGGKKIEEIFFLALDILVKAIEKAGYTGKIKIGMDVAASEFYDEAGKQYDLNNKEPGKPNYVNRND